MGKLWQSLNLTAVAATTCGLTVITRIELIHATKKLMMPIYGKIIYENQFVVIVLSFYAKYQFGLEIHDAVLWETFGKMATWQQWYQQWVKRDVPPSHMTVGEGKIN